MISERAAACGLFVLFFLFLIFHLLVLGGLVPSQVVWGGSTKSREQLIRLEAVALFVNALLLAFSAVRAGYLKINVPQAVQTFVFWAMFGLFVLNTLGNLLSSNLWEKVLFTPATLLIALFSLRLALGKTPKRAAVHDN